MDKLLPPFGIFRDCIMPLVTAADLHAFRQTCTAAKRLTDVLAEKRRAFREALCTSDVAAFDPDVWLLVRDLPRETTNTRDLPNWTLGVAVDGASEMTRWVQICIITNSGQKVDPSHALLAPTRFFYDEIAAGRAYEVSDGLAPWIRWYFVSLGIERNAASDMAAICPGARWALAKLRRCAERLRAHCDDLAVMTVPWKVHDLVPMYVNNAQTGQILLLSSSLDAAVVTFGMHDSRTEYLAEGATAHLAGLHLADLAVRVSMRSFLYDVELTVALSGGAVVLSSRADWDDDARMSNWKGITRAFDAPTRSLLLRWALAQVTRKAPYDVHLGKQIAGHTVRQLATQYNNNNNNNNNNYFASGFCLQDVTFFVERGKRALNNALFCTEKFEK
jgi:hypothetical protein